MSKTENPPECHNFMVYMNLDNVKEYLRLALSTAEDNKCELALGFVEDALELVEKLQKCFSCG
jgi:hypothetical protein